MLYTGSLEGAGHHLHRFLLPSDSLLWAAGGLRWHWELLPPTADSSLLQDAT